jgi:hypothetical protein
MSCEHLTICPIVKYSNDIHHKVKYSHDIHPIVKYSHDIHPTVKYSHDIHHTVKYSHEIHLFMLFSSGTHISCSVLALTSDILPKYSITQLSHVTFVSRTNLCLQVLTGWFYTVLSRWCKRTLPSIQKIINKLIL